MPHQCVYIMNKCISCNMCYEHQFVEHHCKKCTYHDHVYSYDKCIYCGTKKKKIVKKK